MAFTADEQQKIRQFLGYSEIHPQDISHVSSAISLVGDSSEAATEVRQILTRLDAVDSALDVDAIDVTGVASVGTGDPEFFEGAKVKELRSLGRGLCQKLSIKMGIDVVRDYFGSSSGGGPLPTFFG